MQRIWSPFTVGSKQERKTMPKLTFITQASRLLDRFSDWLLQRLLAIDGYRLASLFLFLLWVGARLDSGSNAFTAIQRQIPFLTATWWEITFMVCAAVMYRLPPGRYEGRIALLFFIVPVTAFFGLLILVAFLGRTTPPPYFLILLTMACVFIIDTFVARTRALNYCKRYIAEQEVTIRELRKRLEDIPRHES